MIYIIPGMGATNEMYSGSWRSIDGAVFLDWPKDFKGKTITDLAEYLITRHELGEDDCLIGSSLGGIVACEVLNLVPLENVCLIGGAKSKEEVSSFLRVIHPLVDIAPMEFVRIASGKLPMELAQMLHESSPEFIRSMCKAIFNWDGLQPGKRVHRIHGRKDRVIPLPKDADRILEGGHLIAMTHEKECIEALMDLKLIH